jgi:hypothetical protein
LVSRRSAGEGLARCPARRGWLAPGDQLATDQPVTRVGSHDVPAAAAHDRVAAAVARVEAVGADAAVQQIAAGPAVESIAAGARVELVVARAAEEPVALGTGGRGGGLRLFRARVVREDVDSPPRLSDSAACEPD